MMGLSKWYLITRQTVQAMQMHLMYSVLKPSSNATRGLHQSQSNEKDEMKLG